MKCSLATLIIVSLMLPSVRADNAPIDLVNSFVGTGIYDGALYPGAALPFGMVKLSPDTTSPSSAGYNPDKPIVGFSHTHIGGTGGSTFDGQIRISPQTGDLVLPPVPSPKKNETASPGYYAVDLSASDVRVELTAAQRAGFHRYTFSSEKPARLLIDVAAVINNASPSRPAGVCTGSEARFVSDTSMEGRSAIKAGLAGLKYSVYFVVDLDAKPTARGTWLGAAARPGQLTVTGGAGEQTGLYVELAPHSAINVRVGISFTSIEKARANLAASDGMSFDQVEAAAKKIWSDHLAKITIEGGSDSQRRQFYTALYHTVLAPTDVTGDNGNWAPDDQPLYYDIHTLWDTFRSTDPLRILIDPERERGVIRSLLAIYRKTGWLPDAWAYNQSSIAIQGGTNADNVIADAVVKKLGGFDEQLAYAAVHKNATEYNKTPGAPKTYPNSGRMRPYFELGYVPSNGYDNHEGAGKTNEWGSGVSRTLEYAYNDFCVAEVAAATGHAEDAELFRKRSANTFILFDPKRNMFWGKTASGDWDPDADPTKVTFGWMNMFYEGSGWQYRYSVPHDMSGLIARMGGDGPFVKCLDEFFDKKLDFVGNEPGFLVPWLYTYAGRPDKVADRVRAILAKDYKLKPQGYPGDEDVGAMSAWYILASIGLFPNAGQDVYLIGSPIFGKTTLHLGQTGKTLVIEAVGVSEKNRYVQSATLDGRQWDQAWLRHDDIVNGATLKLVMGDQPSKWGAVKRPPSLTNR